MPTAAAAVATFQDPVLPRPLPETARQCLRKMPRDGAERFPSSDAPPSSVTKLIWSVRETPFPCAEPRGCSYTRPVQHVSIQVTRGRQSQQYALGEMPGLLLALDLSACTNQPRGGGFCARQSPPPQPGAAEGLLSRFAVIDTHGYVQTATRRWLVVHDADALFVVESTDRLASLDALCSATTARLVLEVPHPADAPLQEAIVVTAVGQSEPHAFSCQAAWENEPRCTG